MTQSSLQCAQALPTDFLAGQVLMVGVPASQLGSQTPLFRQYHVGGAVLMSSPADPYDGSIAQFKTNAGTTRDPLFVATDEEGGVVQRFRTLGTLPAPANVVSNYSSTQAQQLITRHGHKLQSIGVDMVLGPLADVAPTQGTSPLGSRVFASNPHTVTSYAQAYIRGWQAADLLPTLKHFPGMGSASGNTDYQPAVTPPLGSLQQRDFVPYQALSRTGAAVMVGNQTVPGWFDGPASLNAAPYRYLRQTLGYPDNLIVTDSLDAKAVTSTIPVGQAVARALASGADIALLVDPDPTTVTYAYNQRLIISSEAAINQAVQNGTITKHQLATSLARRLAAQHLSACTIAPAMTTH